MKLPKRLGERRDAFMTNTFGADHEAYDFEYGYYRCYKDLMSEVRWLVEALERLDAGYSGMFGHEGTTAESDAFDTGSEIVSQAILKWREFMEVEKDEK